jgi:hypothetical protein
MNTNQPKISKFTSEPYTINTLLNLFTTKVLAIPDIQRPYVWNSIKVRDLIDSLYRGYPIGFVISWIAPTKTVRLKHGESLAGKWILIDGQQRITALYIALTKANERKVNILDKNFKEVTYRIAFNPKTEEFEVCNPLIEKNMTWISDIAELFSPSFKSFTYVTKYCELNPDTDPDQMQSIISKVQLIGQQQIVMLKLLDGLDLDQVTDIFIRINSKGTELNQSDFAMSIIASSEEYEGPLIRKCIDYFCHLAKEPGFYHELKRIDKDFVESEYGQKIEWLKGDNDDLYDPDYKDLLRVSFTSEFDRGNLKDLVSLLSGRNFENQRFEDEIAKETFVRFDQSLKRVINQDNFLNFLGIIKGAGFSDPRLIRSKNNLNFAYVLYLKLREKGFGVANIQSWVKRWFVFSVLTERYTAHSPDTMMDMDIRNIKNFEFPNYFETLEKGELSDAFWNTKIIQDLNNASSASPIIKTFYASFIKENDKSFLSNTFFVSDIIKDLAEEHHIFPKAYLKKHGYDSQEYNQIANYAVIDPILNKIISNHPPVEYFHTIMDGWGNPTPDKITLISNMDELEEHLAIHCVPISVIDMTHEQYPYFLEERRKLMAKRLRKYYEGL